MIQNVSVRARWCDSAQLWVTDSNIPGVHFEHENLSALFEGVGDVINELVEANGIPASTFLTADEGLRQLQEYVHSKNVEVGWWDDLSPLAVDARVPEKLCLIHSEISEAMEGHRKQLMDDKLPLRPAIEVELADAVIRIADLAGALDLDLAGAVVEKIAFNATRADHTREARADIGGKRY